MQFCHQIIKALQHTNIIRIGSRPREEHAIYRVFQKEFYEFESMRIYSEDMYSVLNVIMQQSTSSFSGIVMVQCDFH
jgi:hypothetical protein